MRQVQKAKYGVCTCGVVHYPHRAGWCASGVPQQRQNDLVYGASAEEVAEHRARQERLASALARYEQAR